MWASVSNKEQALTAGISAGSQAPIAKFNRSMAMKNISFAQQLFLSLAAACMLIVAGCASGNYAQEMLNEGDRSIQITRESHATTGARADLRFAEEKLSQARRAYDDGDYDRAARLAQQASIEAEYARRAAAAEKAKLDAERMSTDVRQTRMRVYPASGTYEEEQQ